MDTQTIDGQDGNCATTLKAIVVFKSIATLSRIQSTPKFKIFIVQGLPDKFSLDTLTAFSTPILSKEALKKVEHELEVALRLYRADEYSDAAASFNTILKMCISESESENKSRFYAVVLYCRGLALLKSKNVDDINDGFQMLQSNLVNFSPQRIFSVKLNWSYVDIKAWPFHFHRKYVNVGCF